jgi:HK97 family phage major capsid protein
MNELEKQKTEIDIEIRSLQQNIVDNKINADEAKTKFEELKTRKSDIMKQIALAEAPLGKRDSDNHNVYADIQKSLIEQRGITLNGTGALNSVKEIFKELSLKTEILQHIKYFYGDNENTRIPVLSPGLALASFVAEGANSIAVDSQATLTKTFLTPHAAVSILPISLEALKLGSVNLESELNNIFAESYNELILREVINGSGTGLHFNGLFTSALANTDNQIECGATGTPKMADLVKLAMQINSFIDNAFIVLHPSIYMGILADSTNGVADLYKEELIRNKTIEGVKILTSPVCPNALTSGSVVAVAGRLSDYAIGVAGTITIDVIKQRGDTNTYFQSYLFMNGAPILDKNFYSLVTK